CHEMRVFYPVCQVAELAAGWRDTTSTPRKDLIIFNYIPDIPHGSCDFGAFFSVKPCLPLAQELQQGLVVVGQIAYEEPLPRNVEHLKAHNIMTPPVLSDWASVSPFGRDTAPHGL